MRATLIFLLDYNFEINYNSSRKYLIIMFDSFAKNIFQQLNYCGQCISYIYDL